MSAGYWCTSILRDTSVLKCGDVWSSRGASQAYCVSKYCGFRGKREGISWKINSDRENLYIHRTLRNWASNFPINFERSKNIRYAVCTKMRIITEMPFTYICRVIRLNVQFIFVTKKALYSLFLFLSSTSVKEQFNIPFGMNALDRVARARWSLSFRKRRYSARIFPQAAPTCDVAESSWGLSRKCFLRAHSGVIAPRAIINFPAPRRPRCTLSPSSRWRTAARKPAFVVSCWQPERTLTCNNEHLRRRGRRAA